jgi:hypothetical protein
VAPLHQSLRAQCIGIGDLDTQQRPFALKLDRSGS